MQPVWAIQVLGAPCVRPGAEAARALERKAAALLAYVAIEGPTPRATLAGLLWPSVIDARARNNLRQLVHRLRLHEGLLEGTAELRLGAASVDVAQLRDRLDAGDTQAVADAWLSDTPELLRDQAYDDCPDLAEWLEAERARVLDSVTKAVEAEAERHEAAGDVRRALAYAQRLIELDSLSEAAYRRAMRLHYLAGDRAQALATYHRCQRVLHDTFGVEPLPDTAELARAIDTGTVDGGAPSVARALPVRLRRPPRLVGRDQAWARLEDAWERFRTIVVVGEAGIGKSRLVHDFVGSKGAYLTTKGMPGERNVPYATMARGLGAIVRDEPEHAAEAWVRAELARILPDQFDRPEGQPPIGARAQKLRLYEAAATILRRALEGRVAILNDDLHLWDDASFEVGAYFIARFADSHARSLSTARADEFGTQRMREIERAAERGLAAIIELSPLDAEQVAQLVREVGADGAPPAEEVLELSGGNPFYALELMRSRWQAATTPDDGSAAPARHADAADILDARLRRLSPLAHDLLRVRAFAGTAFSPELAAAVLEVPLPEAQAALDELHRQRLLSSENEAHELVSEAVTERTPDEARRLWHQRVAVHMAAFGAGPAAIASQYLAAWQPAAAYPHLLQAAADAAAVYSPDEAHSWLLRALWAATNDRQRADALLGLDDVGGQRVSVDEARAVLDELESLAAGLQEPALLVETALRRARWLTRLGDHDAASRLATEAHDDARRLGDDDRAERARLTLGDLAYFAGRYDEARHHFLEATASASDAHRLRAYQRLGALEGMRGDVESAVEHHRQALMLARKANDLPLVASLLNSVGADSERLGEYDEATRHFRRAADVAGRVGDRRTAAIALSNAALTHTDVGALGDALDTAERALAAAGPLGVDRSVAMAHFVHGYVLRRLGRAGLARAALRESVRAREAVSDVRGALVARFNLAAMSLEAGAVSERDGVARADAVVAEVETLDIPQFLAWCLVELSFLTADAAAAQARVERALSLDRGEHMALAAATASLRAALLSGESEALKRARAHLSACVRGSAFLETSLAHLLLARSADGRHERERELALARERVELELGRLGKRAVRSRLAYLQRRVPPEP